MIRRLQPELALDCQLGLAENPIWEVDRQRLRFIDIYAGGVHWWDPATGEQEQLVVDQHVGAVAARAGGGLVLALEQGFFLLDPGETVPRLVAPLPEPAPGERMRLNDGKTDRRGRFWAGSMTYDFREGAGSLFRMEADGSIDAVVPGATISNGLGWSPDDRILYYADSTTRRVDQFDFDLETGAVANRRPFVTLDGDLPGALPDGLTVDAEGCVWVALFRGGRVHCYTPAGVLDTVVEMPTGLVTCCGFGGPALEDMFVTTGFGPKLSGGEDPHAGNLFVVSPGRAGIAEPLYRG